MCMIVNVDTHDKNTETDSDRLIETLVYLLFENKENNNCKLLYLKLYFR